MTVMDSEDEGWLEFQAAVVTWQGDGEAFTGKFTGAVSPEATAEALGQFVENWQPIAEMSRDLVKQADLVYKLAGRLIDRCESELGAKESNRWQGREVKKVFKELDGARQTAIAELKQVRYFFRQAQWLMVRFPDAELRDVEGLVRLVDRQELEANDWSLTPGRYVGVAPEEVDEEFDFEEALRDIHVELSDLNQEAVSLAAAITRNFEELGI